MAYRSYNAGREISHVSADARNSERVNEVNRNVNDIRSEILTLKIQLQALMEILAERGVEPEAVNAKIEEIMTRPETFIPTTKLSMSCPKCGKTVIDNGNTPLVGTCLYCGEVVKFAPLFKIGVQEPEQPQTQTDSYTDPLSDPFSDNL